MHDLYVTLTRLFKPCFEFVRLHLCVHTHRRHCMLIFHFSRMSPVKCKRTCGTLSHAVFKFTMMMHVRMSSPWKLEYSKWQDDVAHFRSISTMSSWNQYLESNTLLPDVDEETRLRSAEPHVKVVTVGDEAIYHYGTNCHVVVSTLI
jgi:hypothetical protein